MHYERAALLTESLLRTGIYTAFAGGPSLEITSRMRLRLA